MRISPLDAKDSLTEDEQKAEGIEEADIIEYNQEFKLFNSSDYLGKSKGLNLNYNKNMKIELYKKDEDNNEIHLDTYTLTDLSNQLQNEMDFQKKEKERAKKKADKAAADKVNKAANETTEGEEKKDEKKEEETKKVEVEAAVEDDTPIIAPKVKVSVEFTRSGIMVVTKAVVGTHFVNINHERKAA
jgi:FKBP-type peptidyl-prolyl cis-trans isomerase